MLKTRKFSEMYFLRFPVAAQPLWSAAAMLPLFPGEVHFAENKAGVHSRTPKKLASVIVIRSLTPDARLDAAARRGAPGPGVPLHPHGDAGGGPGVWTTPTRTDGVKLLSQSAPYGKTSDSSF